MEQTNNAPLFLITCIEWTVNAEDSFVGYSHEMVYPNDENKLYRGASALELLEWQLTAIGKDRFDYIHFEDPVFEDIQNREWDNNGFLSHEEQQAMILSEYQKRGCLEFRDCDLSIYWVKEITEAEYAIYKRCVAENGTQPLPSAVGEWLGERPEE